MILTQLDLIREAARLPEVEYLFRHALTQEAAYNTILMRQREEYHRQVGEALESLYPERREELAPLLGFHYLEGKVYGPALEYFRMAGDAAFRLFANSEAASHYAQAVSIARLISGVDLDQLIHLYRNLGRALELSARYEQALQNYIEMEAYAEEIQAPALRLAALTTRAALHSISSSVYNPELGKKLSLEALSLAKQVGEREVEARILWNLLLPEIYGQGDPHQGVIYGERSLAIAREIGLAQLIPQVLNDLAMAYAGTGDMPNGLAALEEARGALRQQNNLPMLVNNLFISSIPYYLRGEYPQALSVSLEALEIREKTENLWGQQASWVLAGNVHLELGEFSQAMTAFRKSITASRLAGLEVTQAPLARAPLGWAYCLLGDVDTGLSHLRQAARDYLINENPGFRSWPLAILAYVEAMKGDLESAEANIQTGMVGLTPGNLITPGPVLLRLAKGLLLLKKKDFREACQAFEEMIAIQRKTEIRTFLPDALYHLADARQALNPEDVEAAYQPLDQAYSLVLESGSRRFRWQIEAALSQHEAARGHSRAAESWRAKAVESIHFLADRAGEDRLRQSFLQQPQVQSILNQPALLKE